MKNIINDSKEIVSNNIISIVRFEDDPNSKFVHFANVINGLYQSFVQYVDVSDSSNSFIDFVNVEYPENKSFVHFVKIISDVDFYIRKFSDKISLQDFKSFLFSKQLNDIIVFSEDVSFDVNKNIQDQIIISDVLSVDVLKPLKDSTKIQDSVFLTVDFKRIFPEIILFDETILFSISKTKTDFIFIDDSYSSNVNKLREDSFELTDNNTKSVSKYNQDVINFVEGTIFDVEKITNESIILKDIFSINIQKAPFLDSFSFSDTYDGVLNKIKYENINFDETAVKETSKQLKQNIIVVDAFSFNLEKAPFFDSFSLSDSTTKTSSKNKIDNVLFNDYYLKQINKPLNDSINIKENIIINFNKNKIDILDIEDIFSFKVDKSFSENISLSDKLSLGIDKKIPNDNFEIKDSVIGFLSDYSIEGTYFLEDYVGETINF